MLPVSSLPPYFHRLTHPRFRCAVPRAPLAFGVACYSQRRLSIHRVVLSVSSLPPTFTASPTLAFGAPSHAPPTLSVRCPPRPPLLSVRCPPHPPRFQFVVLRAPFSFSGLAPAHPRFQFAGSCVSLDFSVLPPVRNCFYCSISLVPLILVCCPSRFQFAPAFSSLAPVLSVRCPPRPPCFRSLALLLASCFSVLVCLAGSCLCLWLGWADFF